MGFETTVNIDDRKVVENVLFLLICMHSFRLYCQKRQWQSQAILLCREPPLPVGFYPLFTYVRMEKPREIESAIAGRSRHDSPIRRSYVHITACGLSCMPSSFIRFLSLQLMSLALQLYLIILRSISSNRPASWRTFLTSVPTKHQNSL